MSFADFAAGNQAKAMGLSHQHSSGSLNAASSTSFSKSKQAIDAAALKLEQFQRQVLAIKRAAATENANKKLLIDDDLHDRIRFACLLQEEIAKTLSLLPPDPSHSLIKRKLCKDFEVISSQLEAAVVKISAREQAMQDALKQETKHDQSGRIVVEHQGQVLQFEELEHDIAHNEALIEEREKDIEKIHQSVTQVNEIFRDLAAIVQDQQTSIDEIETHVHQSLEQTQQGLEQVKKASEMQRSCIIS